MSCSITGCITGMTLSEKTNTFSRIRQFFGAPIVKVELLDSHFEQFLCHSIEEYSVHINDWFLQNRLGEMLGLPSEIDFTLKYVSNTLYFERAWATSIAEQIGLGANGVKEYKTGSIALTARTQDYYIPADREVAEVLWYTPSFINMFGLDPFAAGNNIDYYEFGASFAGNSLYHVLPVFDTILAATAAEMRNRVRGAEYSYSLHPGPNRTKLLRLYPVPTSPNNSGNIGPGTPGTVFYRYYDRVGVAGNPLFSGNTGNPGWSASTSGVQGNGLVSTFADAQLNVIRYEQLNSNAKKWILDYSIALAARTLSMIRGKFGGNLPIPDAELSLNSEALMSFANTEMERLNGKLKDELTRLSYKSILEERASIQESINKSQSYGPLDISVY